MNAPMKARAIDSFPAPTLDEIKRFEARNGVVLPEEYVEFLLASNGGLFTGEYALVGPP
ncbi:MAG: SMI1/KNR4 family protein, partial [Thermoguttaceae bacterium]|nr:SMI1/KNR4 family protein [Thermoguttaceae bacterium]